ncbi:hypothetical protein PCANC_16161 [Puccinia coronata f. sp. avenae]|uniref:Uncharacterized protein n=1 Tax=Puccinia coronata f. sp. avenae TaxID=200324 RepID=A0A2N5T0W8_9BASI|nr:hypothetical protein PCANC_16161 [Puccinia coronata f. sp. avenae]
MLSTVSRPIGGKDNLAKRHTAWPNLQPQNIEAARGSNPHQKQQAAGLGFLLTHFARNELGSNAAIGAPLLCPCTDTETEDGPGAELLPTPGRSYVAPSRPVAALGRYQAACARSSSGPACDDSGYRRITVAHPFCPGDPWRRRGGMGTGSGTVSQVAPLVRFAQSCDQAGTAASSGRALSWEIVPLCMYTCNYIYRAGVLGLSGHSFRVGGASFRHALGIPDAELCKLGRWTSNCFQLYLRTYSPDEKAAALRWLKAQPGHPH